MKLSCPSFFAATVPDSDEKLKKLISSLHLQTERSNIRVLGRRGVLVLNAIASMNQLAQIEEEMPVVIGMVNFQESNR